THHGATLWSAFHPEAGAHQFGAMRHGAQAEPRAIALVFVGNAGTVVADREHGVPFGALELDENATGLAVADRVGDRFLRDAIKVGGGRGVRNHGLLVAAEVALQI